MSLNSENTKWNQFLKKHEISIIQKFLPNKQSKILEIGGGNGFQASIFASLGYSIESIDLEPKTPHYFPVKKISSKKLDFPYEEFDLIFTSNVVAHVEDKPFFFKEISRVLKNNGMMIHIVPSTWWSLFTNFWHYLFIINYLSKSFKKRISKSQKPQENSDTISSQNCETTNYKLKRLFFHPLGTNPSFIHELYFFSKYYWKLFFKSYNFSIISVEDDYMITTGYGVFKNKLINFRRFFGRFLPSYYCFVLKKSSTS